MLISCNCFGIGSYLKYRSSPSSVGLTHESARTELHLYFKDRQTPMPQTSLRPNAFALGVELICLDMLNFADSEVRQIKLNAYIVNELNV